MPVHVLFNTLTFVYILGVLGFFALTVSDLFRLVLGMMRADDQLRRLRGSKPKSQFQREFHAGAYDHVAFVAELRALRARELRNSLLLGGWMLGGAALLKGLRGLLFD